jgi:hypothetical protein
MPSLRNDYRLGERKTYDSDRYLCFQLDKHEVEWGGHDQKQDLDPCRYVTQRRNIYDKYLLKLQGLFRLNVSLSVLYCPFSDGTPESLPYP